MNTDFDYAIGPHIAGQEGSHGTSILHWPDGWGVGISWRPIQTFQIAFDFSSSAWSEATIDEVVHPGGPVTWNVAYPSLRHQADQMDAAVWRMGGEYHLPVRTHLAWILRAGYFRQELVMNRAAQPYLAATVAKQPVCNGFSVGVGAVWGWLKFDAAYVWGSWTERALVTEEDLPPENTIGPMVDARVDADMHRLLISATLTIK